MTGPGGGLSTGPQPYWSNQPLPKVLVEYLAEHGMHVEYMAGHGHPEAREYLDDQ